MSRYIIKYKGTYRLKAPYDLQTKAFPKDKLGHLDSSYDDIYIACCNKDQVYHYGHGVLCALIQSPTRGHNYKKMINKIDKSIIIDFLTTDAEALIKFKDRDFDKIKHIFKPLTAGAGISPFSTRNLPDRKKKYADYEWNDAEAKKELKTILKKLWEKDSSIYLKLYGYLKKIHKTKSYYGQKYAPFDMIEVNRHVEQALQYTKTMGKSQI